MAISEDAKEAVKRTIFATFLKNFFYTNFVLYRNKSEKISANSTAMHNMSSTITDTPTIHFKFLLLTKGSMITRISRNAVKGIPMQDSAFLEHKLLTESHKMISRKRC